MTESSALHNGETPPANPYPGPQPFTYAHRAYYFGRERETSELASLIAARGLVLFYAESGAGKSSLIRAGLTPLIGRRGYDVLPVARVAGVPYQGIQPDNIFAFNVMVSIDDTNESPEQFATLTLSQFLQGLKSVAGKFVYSPDRAPIDQSTSITEREDDDDDVAPRRLLIIDQFEELFTSHKGIATREMREEFLRQIRQALQDIPSLYVLLSMRADYQHLLNRYRNSLPEALDTQYYMSRLSRRAAELAVKGPAEEAERPFDSGLAEELVALLAREHSEGEGDGHSRWILGETVEPVQLQVVCQTLWESLDESADGRITEEDLRRLALEQRDSQEEESAEDSNFLAGFVNSALQNHYESAVRAALVAYREASADIRRSDLEMKLRNWFARELISDDGTRSPIVRGPESTEGIPDQVVKVLLKKRIIREETRAGNRLIELIHDSFVSPVRAANEAYFTERIRDTPWMQAARAYAAGEQAELLTGKELKRAMDEAGDREQLSPEERTFLDDSITNQSRLDLVAKDSLRGLLMLLTIVVLAALTLAWQLDSSNAELLEKTDLAQAQTDSAFRAGYRARTEAFVAQAAVSRALLERWNALSQANQAQASDLARRASEQGNPDQTVALALAANKLRPGVADSILMASTQVELKSPVSWPSAISETKIYPGVRPNTVVVAVGDQVGSIPTDRPVTNMEAARILEDTVGLLLATSGTGRLSAVHNDWTITVEDPSESQVTSFSLPDLAGFTTDAMDFEISASFSRDETELAIAACSPSGKQQVRQEEEPDTLAIHQSNNDTVEGHTNQDDNWEFLGKAGDEVVIRLRSIDADPYDPIVELYDSNGTFLDRDDDGDGDRNSRLVYRLNADDTYTIVPGGYAGSSGEYELQLSVLSVSNATNPTTPGYYSLQRPNAVPSNDLGSFDCDITVWSVVDGSVIARGEVRSLVGGIVDLEILRPRTLVAVLGGGELLTLGWSKNNELILTDLRAATSEKQRYIDAAVSTDGDMLATAGCYTDSNCLAPESGFVQLWSITDESIERKGLSLSLANAVGALTFLPNTSQLVALGASPSKEGTLYLWELDSNELKQRACQSIERNLTYSEWENNAFTAFVLANFGRPSVLDPLRSVLVRPIESIVCDDSEYGLDISFALEAVRRCEFDLAMEMVNLASLEGREEFADQATSVALTASLTVAGDRFVDSVLLDDCLNQLFQLEEYPAGAKPSMDELLSTLQQISMWQTGTQPSESDLEAMHSTISTWEPPVLAETIMLTYIEPELERYCPIRQRSGAIELGSASCTLRFKLAGHPRELPDDGTAVRGNTGDAQPFWSFYGEEGEFVSVSMRSLTEGSLDAFLELLDSHGDVIQSDDDSGRGLDSLLVFQIPDSDEYFIRATDLGDRLVDYELALVGALPQPLPISDEVESVSHVLTAYEVDTDRYDTISVRVSTDDDAVLPLIQVWNSERQLLDSRHVSEDAPADERTAVLNYQVGDSGRYFIIAANRSGELGSYDFDAQTSRPDALGTESLDGVTVTGTSSWWLDVSPFEVLLATAQATNSSQAIPRLVLMDEQGFEVAYDENYDSTPRAELSYQARGTGRYLLQARNEGNGEFAVNLQRAQAPALSGGDVVTGTTRSGPVWQFSGVPGELSVITMNRTAEDFDPYLRLYDDNGRQVANDDDSGEVTNARLVHYHSSNDPLYISPEGFGGTSGEFTLTLENLAPSQWTEPGQQEVEYVSAWTVGGEPGQITRVALMDGDQSAIEGLLVLTGDGEPSNTKQSEVVLTWSDDETRTVIVAANEDEAEVWLSSEDMTSSIDGNLEPEQALETTLPTAGQGYWTVGAEEADLGTIYSFEVLSAEAPFTARVFSPRGEILDEGSGEAINPVLLSAPVSDVGSYVIVVHADDDTVDPRVGLALQQLTAQPTEQSCGMSHENVTYGDVDYGSRVVLGEHTDFEGEMYWASDMANYVGQIAIVEELAGVDLAGCPIVRVDVDRGDFVWRIRDLQLLEP